jgi:FkbM family methyltransferase
VELPGPLHEALAHVRRSVRGRLGLDIVQAVDSLGGHLDAVFGRLGIDHVLDVGAHRGDYGAFLRRLGYRDRITSFEPVEETFRSLSARCARDPLWDCYRLALGGHNGTGTIKVTQGTDLSSFLAPSRYGLDRFPGLTKVVREEEVRLRRLDSLLPSLFDAGTDRLFLKIDAQGWDLEVLRGAEEVLPLVTAVQMEIAVKPIYEHMPTCLDALGHLERRGFEVTGLFPVTRDDELRVLEFDLIVIRTSAS